MFLQAAQDLDIDLEQSYMIGDHWSDAEAGMAAGCQAILLRTGHGPQEIDRVAEEQLSSLAFVAEDLAEAAEWIIETS